jgi:CheY-like chemotaxis protein
MIEKKVLVADDEDFNRDLIPRYLKDICPVKIDLAKNAAEAIESARGTNYDHIVLDNNMHDMPNDPNSGVYAIREIRKFNSTVAITLFSGGLSNEAREAAVAAGVSKIIAKPDYHALVQWVGASMGAGNERNS